MHRGHDFGFGIRPDTHFLLTTLLVSDDAAAELVLHLFGFVFVTLENLGLVGGGFDVVDRERQTALAGVAIAQRLDAVECKGDNCLGKVITQAFHDFGQRRLTEGFIDMAEASNVAIWQRFFENQTAWCGVQRLGDGGAVPNDRRVQRDVVVVERIDELGHRAIGTTLAFSSVDLLGEVIATDDEVLVRRHDWTTRRWRQQVVGRQHEHACFGLGLNRQRQVHCHLVAVEVSVERGAHEWVQVNGFAFHQLWLECLNAQTVQGWCTVEQHGVFFNDFFEHIPHERVATLDHALGALDVLGQTTIIQLAHHEWLEQLERHQLRQTTLVQTQCWAGDDNRAAGIVDTLAEQVLAETALLALQHV